MEPTNPTGGAGKGPSRPWPARMWAAMMADKRILAGSIVALAVVIAVSLIAALSGGSSGPATAASTPASSTSTSASATPTPTPTPTTPKPVPTVKPVDPLTGGTVSANPVVAVKIDDTAPGRPQVGLGSADVVYVEQVEGGLTRLVSLFHTTIPQHVEPVRSVRANDPELLAQYGPIGFVASGGGGDAPQALRASTLRASVNDWGGPGFSRDSGRGAPYNLQSNLQQVAQSVGAGPAKKVGFTFAATLPATIKGTPALAINTVVGGTGVNFAWDNSLHQWRRLVDGVPQVAIDPATGAQVPVSAQNVIVQFCPGHVNSSDIDVAGNPGWFTETIGVGRAVIFRDGKAIEGKWGRASMSAGTTFVTDSGVRIPLAPGKTWVVLANADAPLTGA